MPSDLAIPPYVTQAFDLMDAVDGLRDPILIRDRIYGLLKQFGFTSLMMTRLPLPRERIAPHMLIRIWPAEWLSHYDGRNYYRHDPVAERCINTLEPFRWSDYAHEADTTMAQRIMGEARDVGMSDGYCIPVHDVHGFQAVVTMAGDRLDFPARARRTAQLVSLFAFGHIDRLTRPAGPVEPLTQRERDALSFAAIGQNADDIAASMGVATSTAVAHLKSARGKLNATNTTHAVVQALRHRQISI